MSDKTRKIVFRITTSLLTVIVLMFVGNSIFNKEMFTDRFASLGYPTYLIYPLVVAKILGLISIWSDKSRTLKEWAYAGFFFNFVLAFMAEFHVPDGEYIWSGIGVTYDLLLFGTEKRTEPGG
jgi:hypothetical protein